MQGLRPKPAFVRTDIPPLYMSLFNASSAALKAVSPSLKVGGPATMQLFDVEYFLGNCSERGIAVDFVSTHLYPTCPECQLNATQARPVSCRFPCAKKDPERQTNRILLWGPNELEQG